MAAIEAGHADARYIVITDVSEYRLDLARRIGVTLAVNAARALVGDAMAELGMREGFESGLRWPEADRAAGNAGRMTQGRKIAMLGLPAENFGIGWAHLVTNMITIKASTGTRLFETWYEMSVLVHSGLDISPDITHRFDAADSGGVLANMHSAPCGKVSSPGLTGKQRS